MSDLNLLYIVIQYNLFENNKYYQIDIKYLLLTIFLIYIILLERKYTLKC